MGKVIVNETVAGWIEQGMKSAIIINPQHCKNKVVLSNILRSLHAGDLHENGITLTILARAIEEGYEVEYEAKPGDVISFIHEGMEHLRTVQKVDDDVYWFTIDGCWSKGLCKLVSKSENREDMKKDE